MIHILRKRFVVAAMTAVTVLLLVLLGAINGVNAWYSHQQTERLLTMLAGQGPAGLPGEPPTAVAPPVDEEREAGQPPFALPEAGPGAGAPPLERRALDSVYFRANTDARGQVVYVDVSRIASLDETEAEALVRQVRESGESGGTLGRFLYRVSPSRDGQGTGYVFLDRSQQREDVLRVMALSALAGLVCWGLMLLLVLLLAERAIRPIAENMEKQKRFVTDAGHELKTPLAIILANTEAMELHTGPSKWTENIRSQVRRLNGLMQELLALARLDETRSDQHREKLSWSQLLTEEVEQFREPAALKGLTFVRDVQPGVELSANREQLSRLISILLDNAVKYSPPDGVIRVSLAPGGRHGVMQVENTCQSLPDCPPEKLFDRFYRGDDARTQKTGGYGIGLSAARAIAELYRGRITAAYGEGETIRFTVKL